MSERHNRRSIRLKGHDYSSAGAYFVTVCSKDRECLFGEVVDGQMRLNDAGRSVVDTWSALPDHYSGLETEAFVVMPNHVHGIIILNDRRENDVGAIHELPLRQTTKQNRRRMTIPLVIGRFKMTASKHINALRQTPGRPLWQRNYYEHIIRDEDSIERIRTYIADNPAHWEYDRENPEAIPGEDKDAWAF